MRPVRVELEGFSAFKEPTVVDFEGVDLFAFAGPTGSGKSSVIDAVVFALYGSVPRYDDNRLVAPIITQGSVEAKVRLTFTVGDDTYTAVRVVRRTRTGASTREARLERGDETVAGDAPAVNAAVQELVGLSFAQFTTCVVLPQGKFATLLHETPARRQDLLVKLLDLGLYEQLAALARQRERDAAKRVELLDEQLRADAGVTPEARARLAGRVEAVEALVAEVERVAPARAELERSRDELGAALQRVEERAGVLGGVEVPADVPGLADELGAARERLAAAEEAEQAAGAAVTRAQAERDALGEVAGLERIKVDHETRADLEQSRARGETMITEAEQQRGPLAEAVDAATAATERARADLEAARVSDLAADLASHLHPGDDCPVCGRELDAEPAVDRASITEARSRLAGAEADLGAARDALAGHDRQLEGYRARLTQIDEQLGPLLGRLDGAPPHDEVVATLTAIAEAEQWLAERRGHDRAARAQRTEATKRLDAARDVEGRARRDLTAVRDRLGSLPGVPDELRDRSDTEPAPPSPGGHDLVDDWQALERWAASAATAAAAALDRGRRRVAELEERAGELDKSLSEAFDRAGVPLDADPRAAATTALDTAKADLARHDERRDRVRKLTDERARFRETQQVHQLLKGLLGSSGFEQWLLDEALEALVEGATRWLDQLSSGAYALTLDEGGSDFCVVDHRNAGEVRLARTLSGGETFLASLGLALALAERVSELSASGAPRLEAIFLDEGFGTLDPETLDVVATAIEELGATGRMVGVVSHVRDLAERVPTRYEVRRGPSTSTVERIDR